MFAIVLAQLAAHTLFVVYPSGGAQISVIVCDDEKFAEGRVEAIDQQLEEVIHIGSRLMGDSLTRY